MRSNTGLNPITASRIVLATAAVTPLLMWQDVVRYIPAYLQGGVPAGQTCYLAAKVTGTAALLLLLVHLFMALLAGRVPLRWLRLSKDDHRRLGLATLLFSLSHALVFAAAASLRTEHLAWRLFTPIFSEGYWRSLVSVGWFALLGLAIAAIAGFLRTKGKSRGAPILHRLGTAFALLALFHSIAIGSESSLVIGIVTIIAITAALLFRFKKPVGRHCPPHTGGAA